MKKQFTEEQIIGFLEGGRCQHPDEGTMTQKRLFGGRLLPLAQQVWRHERARSQATEGARKRKHPAKEVAGRVHAGA